MFANRRRRRIPELNTTSTADISFMLLTFFLVTTSMDSDKGLPRQLPPLPQPNEQREVNVSQRNVLNVNLDVDDHLTCDGRVVTLAQLKERVMDFVANRRNLPTLPEKRVVNIDLLGRCSVTYRHVVSVQADAHTSYDAYFNMQNAIVAAYNQLRDQLALQRFGHRFGECSSREREAIVKYYPQRISEAEPNHTKGGDEQ